MSKHRSWTPEEFDAKVAELRSDPVKAANFKADLVAKIGKQFEDMAKREASLPPDSVESDLRDRIEAIVGTQFGSDLQISFPNQARTYVWFDLWYETDDQLRHDLTSGRHKELTAIFSRVAREYASAESEVRFHSHQHVREKCGGNYFNYFYFGFLK